MVKICQTGLLKSNFETRPKKRIFRFLPKISAGHGWSLKFFFANFQILGPLGCQGWVVIPQNVKKSQNHCTLLYTTYPDTLLHTATPFFRNFSGLPFFHFSFHIWTRVFTTDCIGHFWANCVASSIFLSYMT
jgi:hypothetical protein